MFSSLGTSDIQGRYSPKGIDLYPYTWKRPNSFQNNIHSIYVSRGRFTFFQIGTPPNSIGFHCKVSFSHCSTAPVVGVTLGELEKLIFFHKTKINLSFRVTWCFFNVPVQELQTSRVATPQRELIYTLIHGRDPIPCRTTYIEYKSQGEDSLFLNRNTTQFHWFSWQTSFFFIVL